MTARAVAALAFLAAGLSLARPAFALDCARATARPDKLICADPALEKADGAMAAAYRRLRDTLPKEEQPGLLANQRRWLADRAACAMDGDGKPVADAQAVSCMIASTKARAQFLGGVSADAAPGAPQILPRFVYRPGGRDRYAVEIAYPVIQGTDTPALKAANKLLRENLVGQWDQPQQGEGDSLAHQADYQVTRISSGFLSIAAATYDNNNAAYPLSGGASLNVDLATGKLLPLSALLQLGSAAQAAKICTAALSSYYSKVMGEPWAPDAAAVAETARDVGNWSFYPDHAVLAFREGSIGPHAMGAYDCRIDRGSLAGMINPRGPLAAH